MNGEFYGVYTNIEAEDKQFLKRWFKNHRGNLYEKDGYSDFKPGSESGFDLETNEKTNDTSDLTELLSVIHNATDSETYLEDLGKRIDTDRLLKFIAVEGMVNQWDSLSFTMWWTHNFRLYHDPDSQKFVFIPWGHDLCLKPALYSGRPYIRMFNVMHRADNRGSAISSSILFRRCLTSPNARSAYKNAIQEVIDVWERLDIESAARRYYTQIRPYVYIDERKSTELKSPLSNQQFEEAYQQLQKTIRGRLAAVRSDLRNH